VTEGVDLSSSGESTAVVSGTIQLSNPGENPMTSVMLAVDETFNPTFASGEAPPGLRIWPVSGDFAFEGVPDGNYVVLAAFANIPKWPSIMPIRFTGSTSS
jgi:hypothetical protein